MRRIGTTSKAAHRAHNMTVKNILDRSFSGKHTKTNRKCIINMNKEFTSKSFLKTRLIVAPIPKRRMPTPKEMIMEYFLSETFEKKMYAVNISRK